MTFRPDGIEDFLAIFRASADRIRNAPGCRHLELLHDLDYAESFTTYSLWESVEDLEAYRNSALFKSTWEEAKSLFSAPPIANSYEVIHRARSDDTNR